MPCLRDSEGRPCRDHRQRVTRRQRRQEELVIDRHVAAAAAAAGQPRALIVVVRHAPRPLPQTADRTAVAELEAEQERVHPDCPSRVPASAQRHVQHTPPRQLPAAAGRHGELRPVAVDPQIAQRHGELVGAAQQNRRPDRHRELDLRPDAPPPLVVTVTRAGNHAHVSSVRATSTVANARFESRSGSASRTT